LNKHKTCRSALARDLPGTGSKSYVCGLPDTAEVFGLTTASQQIAGKVERHPGRSYALRAESEAGEQRCSLFAWPWLLMLQQSSCHQMRLGSRLGGGNAQRAFLSLIVSKATRRQLTIPKSLL